MRNLNPSISEDLNRIFNFKGESTDNVADFIQPVKEIQQRVNFFGALTQTASTGASATIIATPVDKDTYLTGLSLSLDKNATCDVANGRLAILATVDNVARTLVSLASTTLKDTASQIALNFVPPIKIDRNTNIQISSFSFAAGQATRLSSVWGYTQETTKGV